MTPWPNAWLEAQPFRTTHWSVVLAAGREPTPESAVALESLCRVYWYPVYSFIRRLGQTPLDAADLTQDFFARLISTSAIAGADPARGRFRSFLLTAAKHFVTQEWRKQHRQKRGGDAVRVPFDVSDAEGRYSLEPVDLGTPDQAYDRQWAEALLARVLDRLRAECEGRNKGSRFEVLKTFLVEAKGSTTYAAVASHIGLTETAARALVMRLRRRYREIFLEEIAQTVVTPEDVAAEIRHLFSVLASG